MLKRSTRSCPYCPATFRGEADDDQHRANMLAESALIAHLAEHPIGARRGS